MSHFAKRHYQAIALTMQASYPEGGNSYYSARRDQWYTTRNAFVSLFVADNDRFDANRFKIACLPGADVRARRVA